jgi:hypothetical protein
MPDTLAPVPIELWRWGIQNRSGRLRSTTEDALRIALLPRQKVTLSENGINCFGAFYTSKELIGSGWLHRIKQNRPASLMAAYDPVSADTVFVFPDVNKADYWECSLTDRSREFRGLSMWELWDIQKSKRKTVAASKLEERENKRTLEKKIQETIQNAEALRPADFGKSKNEALAGIRQNRKEARAFERKERRASTRPSELKSNATISYLVDHEEDGAYPDFLDELFEDKE